VIVNARRYSATPAVKQAWKAVLQWVMRRAGLDWQLLDHDAPAPLSEIDALAAGTIDVGPLDSYYYDLLRKNDPDSPPGYA
jgi:hypothetical protein